MNSQRLQIRNAIDLFARTILKFKEISTPTMTDHYTLTPSQIVIYTTDYCSDCLRVKKFFEVNSIPYLRIGLEGNAEATDFVMQVNNGYRSVPTIIFPDGTILVEPSWEELKIRFITS